MARVFASPRKNGWEANSPDELGRALLVLEDIQADFNARAGGGRKVSIADLIVIGGNAEIERAAQQAGLSISMPFTPGPHRCERRDDRRGVDRSAQAHG